MPAPESVPAPSAIQAKTMAATASARREPRAASAIWARVGTGRTLSGEGQSHRELFATRRRSVGVGPPMGPDPIARRQWGLAPVVHLLASPPAVSPPSTVIAAPVM